MRAMGAGRYVERLGPMEKHTDTRIYRWIVFVISLPTPPDRASLSVVFSETVTVKERRPIGHELAGTAHEAKPGADS
jgi:hypothetical protein